MGRGCSCRRVDVNERVAPSGSSSVRALLGLRRWLEITNVVCTGRRRCFKVLPIRGCNSANSSEFIKRIHRFSELRRALITHSSTCLAAYALQIAVWYTQHLSTVSKRYKRLCTDPALDRDLRRFIPRVQFKPQKPTRQQDLLVHQLFYPPDNHCQP